MSKTVAQKMYLKPGMKGGFFNAPDNVRELLGLPERIKIIPSLETGDLDFVLGFIEDRAMLEDRLTALKSAIKESGALWIAYHKGTSSVDTDINRDSIHEYARANELKGVGMVSINSNWSGFRFKKV